MIRLLKNDFLRGTVREPDLRRKLLILLLSPLTLAIFVIDDAKCSTGQLFGKIRGKYPPQPGKKIPQVLANLEVIPSNKSGPGKNKVDGIFPDRI